MKQIDARTGFIKQHREYHSYMVYATRTVSSTFKYLSNIAYVFTSCFRESL